MLLFSLSKDGHSASESQFFTQCLTQPMGMSQSFMLSQQGGSLFSQPPDLSQVISWVTRFSHSSYNFINIPALLLQDSLAPDEYKSQMDPLLSQDSTYQGDHGYHHPLSQGVGLSQYWVSLMLDGILEGFFREGSECLVEWLVPQHQVKCDFLKDGLPIRSQQD